MRDYLSNNCGGKCYSQQLPSFITTHVNKKNKKIMCNVECTEAEFMNRYCKISLRFLGIILRVLRLNIAVYTDKKISYIRKFRVKQLQSYIWLTASSSLVKYLRIFFLYYYFLYQYTMFTLQPVSNHFCSSGRGDKIR